MCWPLKVEWIATADVPLSLQTSQDDFADQDGLETVLGALRTMLSIRVVCTDPSPDR